MCSLARCLAGLSQLARPSSRDAVAGLCPVEPERGKAWKPSRGVHFGVSQERRSKVQTPIGHARQSRKASRTDRSRRAAPPIILMDARDEAP
jgi:hypothetical protein